MSTLTELGRITLPLIEGLTQVPIRLPQPQANLLDLLPSAWEATHLATADAIQQHTKTGKTISCKPHCGACCRQMVTISLPEAVKIADYVAEQPPERQQVLRDRFAAVVQKLEAVGLLDKNDPPTGRSMVPPPGVPPEQASDALALAYFHLQMPCPFLEEESCSIYEIRPSICREYHVTSPAELCQRLYEVPIDRIVPQFRTGVALMEAGEEVAGLTRGQVPLTLALEWADAVRAEVHQPRDSAMLAASLAQLSQTQTERIQRGEPVSGQAPKPQQTTANIELALQQGRLRLSVTVDNGPISPRALIPLAMALSDATQKDDITTSAKRGKPVSCKPGCAACCRQLVPVSEPEARQLAEVVRRLPEPQQSQVRQRFAEALAKMEQAGLADDLREPQPWPDGTHHRQSESYFAAQIDCPFLEQESCSIYNDRPLSCREHLVTSPAELCRKPLSEQVEPLELTLRSPFRAFARATAGLTATDPVAWVALPYVLEWAANHPEPKPTTTGPVMLKAVLDELSGAGRS